MSNVNCLTVFSFLTKTKKQKNKNSSNGEKVFVAMSGGVDSSLSAKILKDKGYDVTGVFMRLWRLKEFISSQDKDMEDAKNICKGLGIPFLVFDFREEQKKEVVDYMLEEYKKGRTPNPCVICNKVIKFGKLLKEAQKRGADYMATGHYVRKEIDLNGNIKLLRGIDDTKDQSYFLWTLGQEELSKAIFPIGDFEKSKVRKKAENDDLFVAQKKESQEICFLGNFSMKDFLKKNISEIENFEKQGEVLDEKGEVIGEHKGTIFYTIGQRKGFNITKKTPNTPIFYVVSKDIIKNTITVSKDADFFVKEKKLNKIKIKKTNWISGVSPKVGLELKGRLRYNQTLKKCEVLSIDEKNKEAEIFMENIDFPAPAGQSLVLYDEDVCLGGGTIS